MKKILTVVTVFCMVCMMAVPCFAYQYGSLDRPEFTDEMIGYWEDGYNKATFVNRGNGLTTMILTDGALTWKNDGFKLYTASGSKYVTFDYSGGEWKLAGKGSYTLDMVLYDNILEVYWANYTVIKADDGSVKVYGETNFSPAPPLAEQIQAVTKEELETVTVPEVQRVMMVVVAAGLICLASLVGLVVLKKVFRTFGAR